MMVFLLVKPQNSLIKMMLFIVVKDLNHVKMKELRLVVTEKSKKKFSLLGLDNLVFTGGSTIKRQNRKFLAFGIAQKLN